MQQSDADPFLGNTLASATVGDVDVLCVGHRSGAVLVVAVNKALPTDARALVEFQCGAPVYQLSARSAPGVPCLVVAARCYSHVVIVAVWVTPAHTAPRWRLLDVLWFRVTRSRPVHVDVAVTCADVSLLAVTESGTVVWWCSGLHDPQFEAEDRVTLQIVADLSSYCAVALTPRCECATRDVQDGGGAAALGPVDSGSHFSRRPPWRTHRPYDFMSLPVELPGLCEVCGAPSEAARARHAEWWYVCHALPSASPATGAAFSARVASGGMCALVVNRCGVWGLHSLGEAYASAATTSSVADALPHASLKAAAQIVPWLTESIVTTSDLPPVPLGVPERLGVDSVGDCEVASGLASGIARENAAIRGAIVLEGTGVPPVLLIVTRCLVVSLEASGGGGWGAVLDSAPHPLWRHPPCLFSCTAGCDSSFARARLLRGRHCGWVVDAVASGAAGGPAGTLTCGVDAATGRLLPGRSESDPGDLYRFAPALVRATEGVPCLDAAPHGSVLSGAATLQCSSPPSQTAAGLATTSTRVGGLLESSSSDDDGVVRFSARLPTRYRPRDSPSSASSSSSSGEEGACATLSPSKGPAAGVACLRYFLVESGGALVTGPDAVHRESPPHSGTLYVSMGASEMAPGEPAPESTAFRPVKVLCDGLEEAAQKAQIVAIQQGAVAAAAALAAFGPKAQAALAALVATQGSVAAAPAGVQPAAALPPSGAGLPPSAAAVPPSAAGRRAPPPVTGGVAGVGRAGLRPARSTSQRPPPIPLNPAAAFKCAVEMMSDDVGAACREGGSEDNLLGLWRELLTAADGDNAALLEAVHAAAWPMLGARKSGATSGVPLVLSAAAERGARGASFAAAARPLRERSEGSLWGFTRSRAKAVLRKALRSLQGGRDVNCVRTRRDSSAAASREDSESGSSSSSSSSSSTSNRSSSSIDGGSSSSTSSDRSSSSSSSSSNVAALRLTASLPAKRTQRGRGAQKKKRRPLQRTPAVVPSASLHPALKGIWAVQPSTSITTTAPVPADTPVGTAASGRNRVAARPSLRLKDVQTKPRAFLVDEPATRPRAHSRESAEALLTGAALPDSDVHRATAAALRFLVSDSTSMAGDRDGGGVLAACSFLRACTRAQLACVGFDVTEETDVCDHELAAALVAFEDGLPLPARDRSALPCLAARYQAALLPDAAAASSKALLEDWDAAPADFRPALCSTRAALSGGPLPLQRSRSVKVRRGVPVSWRATRAAALGALKKKSWRAAQGAPSSASSGGAAAAAAITVPTLATRQAWAEEARQLLVPAPMTLGELHAAIRLRVWQATAASTAMANTVAAADAAAAAGDDGCSDLDPQGYPSMSALLALLLEPPPPPSAALAPLAVPRAFIVSRLPLVAPNAWHIWPRASSEAFGLPSSAGCSTLSGLGAPAASASSSSASSARPMPLAAAELSAMAFSPLDTTVHYILDPRGLAPVPYRLVSIHGATLKSAAEPPAPPLQTAVDHSDSSDQESSSASSGLEDSAATVGLGAQRRRHIESAPEQHARASEVVGVPAARPAAAAHSTGRISWYGIRRAHASVAFGGPPRAAARPAPPPVTDPTPPSLASRFTPADPRYVFVAHAPRAIARDFAASRGLQVVAEGEQQRHLGFCEVGPFAFEYTAAVAVRDALAWERAAAAAAALAPALGGGEGGAGGSEPPSPADFVAPHLLLCALASNSFDDDDGSGAGGGEAAAVAAALPPLHGADVCPRGSSEYAAGKRKSLELSVTKGRGALLSGAAGRQRVRRSEATGGGSDDDPDDDEPDEAGSGPAAASSGHGGLRAAGARSGQRRRRGVTFMARPPETLAELQAAPVTRAAITELRASWDL